MFIKENIALALAGLKSNKMRAILTMLGIIIGIASVISIVSVGNAMTSSVTSSMADMGTSNIMVNVTEKSTTTTTDTPQSQDGNNGGDGKDSEMADGDPQGGDMPGGGGPEAGRGGPQAGGGGMPGGGGGAPSGGGGMPGGGGGGGRPGMFGSDASTPDDKDLITMDTIKDLEETFSDKIKAVSVSETKDSGKAKDGTAYANVSIKGTNPGYADVENIELIDGRYISDKDMDSAKKVAVVSDKLVTKIFGEGADPIGEQVKIYTSDADRIYWRDKGWIDASYFFDVDINPVKRVFGKILKRLIDILGKKISSGT